MTFQRRALYTWEISRSGTSPSCDLPARNTDLAEQVVGPMTEVERVEPFKKRVRDGDRLQHILASATEDDLVLQPKNEHISHEVAKHFAASIAMGKLKTKMGLSSSAASGSAGTPSPKGSAGIHALFEEKDQLPAEGRHHAANEPAAVARVADSTQSPPQRYAGSLVAAAHGVRCSRAWGLHGFKESAMQSILLKHEDSCPVSGLHVGQTPDRQSYEESDRATAVASVFMRLETGGM